MIASPLFAPPCLLPLSCVFTVQPPTAAHSAALDAASEEAMRGGRGVGSRFGPPPPHVPVHREKLGASCVEAVTSFSGCAPDGTLDNTHVYVVTANLDATMVREGRSCIWSQ